MSKPRRMDALDRFVFVLTLLAFVPAVALLVLLVLDWLA